MPRNRLRQAKRQLRHDKVIKKAGDKSADPDARDITRRRARHGDRLWFPWWRR